MKINNRLTKLRQSLAEKNLDAVLVSQSENRYYLSGFNGTSGWLLITDKREILATDFRYVEQASMQAPDYEIFRSTNSMNEWFPELLSGLSLKRLGFEAQPYCLIFFGSCQYPICE